MNDPAVAVRGEEPARWRGRWRRVVAVAWAPPPTKLALALAAELVLARAGGGGAERERDRRTRDRVAVGVQDRDLQRLPGSGRRRWRICSSGGTATILAGTPAAVFVKENETEPYCDLAVRL